MTNNFVNLWTMSLVIILVIFRKTYRVYGYQNGCKLFTFCYFISFRRWSALPYMCIDAVEHGPSWPCKFFLLCHAFNLFVFIMLTSVLLHYTHFHMWRYVVFPSQNSHFLAVASHTMTNRGTFLICCCTVAEKITW